MKTLLLILAVVAAPIWVFSQDPAPAPAPVPAPAQPARVTRAQYSILSSGSEEELARKVESAMAEGWSPLGGVTVDRNGGWRQLLQAMTKPGARREVPEKKD